MVAGDQPDRVDRELAAAADVLVDTGVGFRSGGPQPVVRCYGDDPAALAAAAETLMDEPRTRLR